MQDIDRIKERVKSVGISIANSSPPPNSANTKVPTVKGSQPYPKIHLSVSSLHSHDRETSRKVYTVESACLYLAGTTTTKHQYQAQKYTRYTPTIPTSILITPILSSCQKKISSVLLWILSIIINHWVPEPPNKNFTQESSIAPSMSMNLIRFTEQGKKSNPW